MPPFPKPKFEYSWNKETQIRKLQSYRARDPPYGIPPVEDNQILVGTWNIANLGSQKRSEDCFDLIAEVIRPFHLIAIQEVNANLKDHMKVMKCLGDNYSCIFTDVAGNEERLCYIYQPQKIRLTELIGELSIPPNIAKNYKMEFTEPNGEITTMQFEGFDRTPYIAAWQFESLKFTTYNCHMYYGSTKKGNKRKFRRRIIEVDSLARWVDWRVKRHFDKEYAGNIILLGDMNIPKICKNDEVYDRLHIRNMDTITYEENLDAGSDLSGEHDYDQLVFVKPFSEKIQLINFNIFAWDNGYFTSLWDQVALKNSPKRTRNDFRNYAKWAISDHRVLWSILQVC